MSDKCNSCGAEIEYEAGSQSLKCPYCGAVNEIKRAEDQVPRTVEKIIPLTVTQDDLEKRAYAYMAGGNYTPDDMLEAATFTKRELLYVPAYLFKVTYEATWTASFGYDRTEHYTEYVTVTKRSGNHSYETQEPRTKTKTVTDWRPANGVDSGIFPVSTYAGKKLFESRRSIKADKESADLPKNHGKSWIGSLANKLESFADKKSTEVATALAQKSAPLPAELVPYAISKGGITEFNPSFLKGVEAENFSVSETNAYNSLKSEISANIDQRVEKHGQGDHQRDWHWNASMSHITNTLYVPICHAVFDYQGTEYHVWIDGMGEDGIRADVLPEDKGRKNLVQNGFLPVGMGFVIWILSLKDGLASFPGFVIVALLAGYAVLRRWQIIGYSKKIRDSLLTQIHASSSTIQGASVDEKNNVARAFQRPEKPFFAKTHHDKFVLPVLTLLAVVGVFFTNVDKTPKAVTVAQIENAVAPASIAAPTLPTVVQADAASAVRTASSAELVKIAETDEIAIYVNPASIQKNGDKATISTLADFKTPKNSKEGKPYLSTTNQEEFDCKENKERLLNIISAYSGNMGNGEVAAKNSESNRVSGEWAQVTNNTLEGAIFKVACGKEAPVPADVGASSSAVVPQSASFDCKKAKSPSEVLICNDSELSKLDYELAETYRQAKAKAVDAQAFKQQTVAAWQWREANCRDNKQCLVTWYAERKTVLLKNIQGGASN